jgi:hypothetical protein
LNGLNIKLDKYYKSMGFEYNEEKSRIYSQVIDSKNRQIMVREINKEISEEEMQLFATR